MASRAPNGSSISRTSASWANARARATRWRMPPDSSWGRLSAKSLEVHGRSSSSHARAGRSRLGTPAQLEGERDVLGHGAATGTAPPPGTSGRVRPVDRRPCPRVGVSSPASRFSSVRLAAAARRRRGRRTRPARTVERDAVERPRRRCSPRPKRLGDRRRRAIAAGTAVPGPDAADPPGRPVAWTRFGHGGHRPCHRRLARRSEELVQQRRGRRCPVRSTGSSRPRAIGVVGRLLQRWRRAGRAVKVRFLERRRDDVVASAACR